MKVELFEQDVTFGSIPYGTCFKHADAVYMRVEGRGSLEEQCAVRFTVGKFLKVGDFGIGSVGDGVSAQVISVADANTATENGWYAASGVAATNFYHQYAPMMAMSRNVQRVQIQVDPDIGNMASRSTGNGGTSWTQWITAGPTAWVIYDAATRAIEAAFNVISVQAAGSAYPAGTSSVHFQTPMHNQHYMMVSASGHGLSDSAGVCVDTGVNADDRGLNQCNVRARVSTSGVGWVTAGGKIFLAFFGGK